LALAAGDVVGHLTNSYQIHVGPWTVDLAAFNAWCAHSAGFSPHLTKHAVMMICAALVTGFAAVFAARRAVRDQGRGVFPNMVEATAVFLRDQVVAPGIGEHHARAWFPLIATLFFFILSCNLLGLLPPPFGATATGNVNVTGGLALITLACMILGGMFEKGVFRFWIGLVPHGVPWWMWPLVWLIEAFGLLTKPFALTVRLFANMTAGHVIMAVLGGFLVVGGPSFGAWLLNKTMVVPPSIAFYLFINVFEVAIAFIQAYIFATLSSIFIGMMLSHEH
jgi:F-type H+-transporting ATPase subunit a